MIPCCGTIILIYTSLYIDRLAEAMLLAFGQTHLATFGGGRQNQFTSRSNLNAPTRFRNYWKLSKAQLAMR